MLITPLLSHTACGLPFLHPLTLALAPITPLQVIQASSEYLHHYSDMGLTTPESNYGLGIRICHLKAEWAVLSLVSKQSNGFSRFQLVYQLTC
jgi:hypothetical protein